MASVLKVDTITGVATAGSIGITGEGNSTTTNLQQGLCKVWTNINMSTPATNDSFNQSSISDLATGRFTSTFTNNLGNSDYAVTASGMDPTEASTGSNRTADGTPVSTSQLYVRAAAYDNTANDVPGAGVMAQGDLA